MMKSVVDSSHTHHHHTTSPTGRLDKITDPPSTRLCVAQHETNIRTEPPAHGGEIKMISEWNPMENEENFLGFDFLAVERTRWLDLHNNQR
jgi:hypothetical protein